MSPQTFIFIGRSGCGKGTQVKFLLEYIKNHDKESRSVYHLETGERFREFIKGETLSSKLSREIYERDDRQPDFLAIWMWSHLLVENLKGDEHLMVDGTPRSLPEAESLHTALSFYKRKANVVYINVSRKWSEKHLLARGRSDDATIAKIDKRLNWFDKDVMPAVEYFRNHEGYNFIEVNGEQEMEKVYADIVEKVKLF
jgi:adenylate kinase family enzyme